MDEKTLGQKQTEEFEALKKKLGLKGNQVTAAMKKYNASTFDEVMQALRNYHQYKYPDLYETCDDCQGDGVLDEASGDNVATVVVTEPEEDTEELPEQPTAKGRFA